jgi:hypothetical protein
MAGRLEGRGREAMPVMQAREQLMIVRFVEGMWKRRGLVSEYEPSGCGLIMV